ncbi:AAA family ATPase [Brevibacillus brevis]|uniref:AAA family ATPase n=1 Tax=Brevibacillus brevis TaxID=1393 RepID=UPI00115787A3|nr:AAA family ATPase [Lysinibacillus sp. SDF0063]TQR37583.1 hypothetical protein C7Y45_06875 [Lysinibacillus sp. SDF0063]
MKKLEHPLTKNQTIDNETLMQIFKCGVMGGMRRSLASNCLVLISNSKSNDYKNILFENNTLQFMGMGRKGNQKLGYGHNKTLYFSNRDRIQLFLFKSDEKDSYTFLGEVKLAGEPKLSLQEDYEGNSRNVLIFPLVEVGVERNITEFLLEFSKGVLVKRNVLDFSNNYLNANSIEPIIELMKKNNVDTLTSHGGWFITASGFFYNEYSSKAKMGSIYQLLETESIEKKDIFWNQNKFINPYVEISTVFRQRKGRGIRLNRQSGKIRIHSLTYDNDLFPETITISPELPSTSEIQPYTSLIIGPNGTGKSLMISFIQQIFQDMYQLKVSKEPSLAKTINYDLTYSVDSELFRIQQKDEIIKFFRKKQRISIDELILPAKVIACAFTLNDRFSYPENNDINTEIEPYQYLGIKTQNKSKYIETTGARLVRNILIASLTDSRIVNLQEVTSFLKLVPRLRIVFQAKNKIALKDTITVQNILAAQLENPNELDFDAREIARIFRAFRMNISLYNRKRLFDHQDHELIIDLDLVEPNGYENYFDEFEAIMYLVSIGLLGSPIIQIQKGNEFFSLEEASSGEFQYLSTMINLLSKIEPSSIILMDEPETSLHPTWQHQYMYGLYNIFKEFNSCHFLIATHSHFLVSDLDPDSSSLITLKRNKESKVEFNLFEPKTYGRTVEDILYNVFDLPSLRNYYFTTEIDSVLLAISLGEVTKEIKEKIHHLNQVKTFLHPSDPLTLIIDQIVKEVD